MLLIFIYITLIGLNLIGQSNSEEEAAKVLIADNRGAEQKYGAEFPPVVECYGTSVEKANLETCVLGLADLSNVLGHEAIAQGIDEEPEDKHMPIPITPMNETSNITVVMLEDEYKERESTSQIMLTRLFNKWDKLKEDEREEYRILLRSQRCLKSVMEFVDPFENWHRQVVRGCERDTVCLVSGILDGCIGLQGLRDGPLKQEFYNKPRQSLRGMITGRVCCCRGSRCNGAGKDRLPHFICILAIIFKFMTFSDI